MKHTGRGFNSRKDILSTGEAARICRVAPHTVSKWVDSGRIKGYCLPGSHKLRIPVKHLIAFLRANNMPLNELDAMLGHKILIIGAQPEFVGRLQAYMPDAPEYRYEVAGNGFQAGVKAYTFLPDTVVIDMALGRTEALLIAGHLGCDPLFRSCTLIALACEDEPDLPGLAQYGFAEAMQKPFDMALLAERIRTLAEQH